MISRRTDVIKRCKTTSLYPVASRKKTNPSKPGESHIAAYVIAFRPGAVGGTLNYVWYFTARLGEDVASDES